MNNHKKWQPRTPALAAGLSDHNWSMREIMSTKIYINHKRDTTQICKKNNCINKICFLWIVCNNNFTLVVGAPGLSGIRQDGAGGLEAVVLFSLYPEVELQAYGVWGQSINPAALRLYTAAISGPTPSG
jgi:hypothetical protein